VARFRCVVFITSVVPHLMFFPGIYENGLIDCVSSDIGNWDVLWLLFIKGGSPLPNAKPCGF